MRILSKILSFALNRHDYLRTILENVCDYGIFLLDIDGLVLTWNPAAERLTGYGKHEIVGRSGAIIRSPDPADYRKFLFQLSEASRVGRVEQEQWHVRKDGTLYWANEVMSAVRRRDGRLTGYVKVMRDLTSRKSMEDERQRLYDEVERVNRAKDEFLATISHELRTPLTAILGWTKLLRTKTFDGKQIGQALEVIERNAYLEARIVEEILDISRIISGKLELEMKPIEISSCVKTAAESVALAAAAKKVALQTEIQPDIWINGDGQRIQQIVMNLLSNSLKFTPANGQILVRVSNSNDHVEIVVEDNGTGIQPHFLPHVFERFTQQESSTSRRYGGLGLGLAICRYLATAHGGNIEAQSEGQGMGSRFRVTLPVAHVGASESRVA